MGKQPAIISACVLIGAAMAAVPLAQDLASLCGLAALWTVGGAVLGSGPTAYVTEVASKRQRGQALALLRTVGDLGMLAGALVAGQLGGVVGLAGAVQVDGLVLVGLSALLGLRAWLVRPGGRR